MLTNEMTQDQITDALQKRKPFVVETENERKRVLTSAKVLRIGIVTRKDPKTEKFNVIFLP